MIYFFCQFDNAESLFATKILGCLIRQCLDAETLSSPIEPRLVNMLKLSCPGAEELGGLLRDVLTDSKASFIVIDAIDECTRAERVILLKDLQKVMKSNSGGVKNFLATRLGIVEEVETTCKTCYYVTMNCPEARSGINTYIEDELAN